MWQKIVDLLCDSERGDSDELCDVAMQQWQGTRIKGFQQY